MNELKALEIIQLLADGINPYTGEEFPPESPYQHPQIVRALFVAIDVLKKHQKHIQRQKDLPENAGKLWSTEEDKLLEDAFDSGKTIAELAEIHRRTRGAIQARLMKLGKIQLKEQSSNT